MSSPDIIAEVVLPHDLRAMGGEGGGGKPALPALRGRGGISGLAPPHTFHHTSPALTCISARLFLQKPENSVLTWAEARSVGVGVGMGVKKKS